jgi:multiple sugar transport system permease protein
MLGVLFYPWLSSLIMSLHAWTPLRPTPPRFVGLDNYTRLLTDQAFINSLANTAILVLSTVFLQFVIGFVLALLLNAVPRGRTVLVTMYLVPLMLTPSVVGLTWKFLLHNEWGLLNWALQSLGMGAIGWLSDPAWTLVTIIIVDVWQHAPFAVLVLLAGLQAIPEEPIEAARVDGASEWQVFRFVKLPYLQPLIITILLFRLIFALRTFDVIYALFRSGGPANAGMVLGVYLYEHLRLTWRVGEAAAISYALLFITIVVASLFLVRWYRSVED